MNEYKSNKKQPNYELCTNNCIAGLAIKRDGFAGESFDENPGTRRSEG